MDGVEAFFNDGRIAKTRRVGVRLSDDVLHIIGEDGTVLASWPRKDIRALDRGRGSGPLRLSGSDKDLALLTVPDPEARALLLAALPDATRRTRLTRENARTIALWSAGAVISLVLIVWVILPVAVGLIAAAIPQSIQAEIGSRIADEIIGLIAFADGRPQRDIVCRDEAGNAALDRLTTKLTTHSRPDVAFRFRVVDTPLVNAMALPGGHILVTGGLIDYVADPNELAGVLGHEIGHVALDHAIESIVKVGGITALFSLLVGDVAGGSVVLAVGQSVIAGAYQQAAEREADLHAVELMHAAGLDSRSFANFFVRLDAVGPDGTVKGGANGAEKKDEGPAADDADAGIYRWIASHPPARERTAAVRKAAKPGAAAMSKADWNALRKICGAGPGAARSRPPTPAH